MSRPRQNRPGTYWLGAIVNTRTISNEEARVRAKHLAIVIGLAMAILASIGLSLDVDRRLSQLREEAPDNIHWVTSRAEIELLQLQRAILKVQADPELPVDEIRLRFDTFYAHVETLARGNAYITLRAELNYAENSGIVHGFIDETVPVVDGDEATLRSELSRIESQINVVLPVMRSLAQRSMHWYSLESDSNRQAMNNTLSRMGLMAVSLVMTLSVLAVFLLRLSRQAQKQARRNRDTANRLQTILETSLDAVIVFDAYSRILAYNGTAEKMFGYTREEALGRQVAELMIPDSQRERFARALSEFTITGRSPLVGVGRINGRARHRNGRTFPVELSIDRIADDGGPILVTFVRDITEQRAAEASLVEARDKALAGERAKADFLAVMSHEMRTPLNGLLGSLSLIRDTQLTPRQRTYIENMDASGRLLLHHVNDVLEISKFEAGKIVIARIPFDLESLLSELVEGQRTMAEAHRNEISFRWIGAPVPAMEGDPVRLRQVLLNLVSNAIKFTRNGAITIEVEAVTQGKDEGEEIVFRVIDTGIGIAPENLDRIFGDFETLDSTYGRRAEGTGLGLGIARRLSTAMQGDLSVESKAGSGSTFTVRLPLERAELEHSVGEPAPIAARSRQLSVLIVEDNQINRVVLRDMLLSEGHRVTEAMHGEEGVKLAEMMEFDLILTDISMPVMDGVQATRAIREGTGRSARAPILAVTAHALPEEIRTFHEAGMNDVIGKPIQRTELQTKLAYYCNIEEPSEEAPTDTDVAAADAPDQAAALVRACDPAPVRPAVKHCATPTETPVDEQRMTELVDDLGADVAGMLLARFIAETEETLDDIEDGTDYSVADMVPRLHRIAGSAAALGASRLHRRLGELEALGKRGDESAFRSGLGDLPPLWAATRERMQALVTQE